MKELPILKIQVENNVLSVYPVLENSYTSYDMVYRSARGIYWNDGKKCFYHKFEKGELSWRKVYQIFVEAIEAEYGVTLMIESDTKWVGIAESEILISGKNPGSKGDTEDMEPEYTCPDNQPASPDDKTENDGPGAEKADKRSKNQGDEFEKNIAGRMKQRTKFRLTVLCILVPICIGTVCYYLLKGKAWEAVMGFIAVFYTGFIFWMFSLLVINESKKLASFREELSKVCFVIKEDRILLLAVVWIFIIGTVFVRIYFFAEYLQPEQGIYILEGLMGCFLLSYIIDICSFFLLAYVNNYRFIVGENIVISCSIFGAVNSYRIDEITDLNLRGENGSTLIVITWPNKTMMWRMAGTSRWRNFKEAMEYLEERTSGKAV